MEGLFLKCFHLCVCMLSESLEMRATPHLPTSFKAGLLSACLDVVDSGNSSVSISHLTISITEAHHGSFFF